VLTRANIRVYTPKRQAVSGYAVEHKNGVEHRAGERCELCEKQKFREVTG
jgi:hypothetical protein